MATEFTPDMIGKIVMVKQARIDGKESLGTGTEVGTLRDYRSSPEGTLEFRFVGDSGHMGELDFYAPVYRHAGYPDDPNYATTATVEVYTPENKKTSIGGFHS